MTQTNNRRVLRSLLCVRLFVLYSRVDGDSFGVSFFPLKMEEDCDLPKTLVKLRRTPSDTPRPASTPPVIAASAIQDEDDEEKIIAELEVRLFYVIDLSVNAGSYC